MVRCSNGYSNHGRFMEVRRGSAKPLPCGNELGRTRATPLPRTTDQKVGGSDPSERAAKIQVTTLRLRLRTLRDPNLLPGFLPDAPARADCRRICAPRASTIGV